MYVLSVLGLKGSISAPDEATLKEEAHALQCTAAGPCDAIPTDLPRVGSTCGLGLDVLGIHILSLATRKRTAVNSGTLVNGLAKIQAAREYDGAPIHALTSEWKDKFLKTSMTYTTMEAFEYVGHGSWHAAVRPRRGHLIHDLITQIFLKKPSVWNRSDGSH